jgi:[acyl-carrier-protein] S-malonyltransferase
MGQDIFNRFTSSRTIFEQVDEICRQSISKLCFEGTMEALTLTVNLQPAITAVNLACFAALSESEGKAAMTAGHSLGEYSALVCAGVVSSYDALRLAQKRGELMHREATSNPGAMAAVIGLDIKAVADIVGLAREEGVLAVANHNTSEQIVISGEKEPVARAVRIVKEKKARAVPLKVSGAWHCRLMGGAVAEFREFMKGISFNSPEIPVLFNVTSESATDPDKIKDIMASQLISPVKWHDTMLKMIAAEIDTFVEIGPKKVLSGLLKKTVPPDRHINIYNLENTKDIETFLN